MLTLRAASVWGYLDTTAQLPSYVPRGDLQELAKRQLVLDRRDAERVRRVGWRDLD